MSYWFIAIMWVVIGTVFFWVQLSRRWAKIDVFGRMSIRTFKTFHPIPGDPDTGFLDLQFSVLRHALFFLISSALIYFVDNILLVIIVLPLNLLYDLSSVFRYRGRKNDLEETASRPGSQATVQMLAPFVKASFLPACHAGITSVLLYILLAIKP